MFKWFELGFEKNSPHLGKGFQGEIYKAVFEESFGGIHINSRRNFHECSDGNFPGDIWKNSKEEFGGNSGSSAWSLNRNFKRGIDGTRDVSSKRGSR